MIGFREGGCGTGGRMRMAGCGLALVLALVALLVFAEVSWSEPSSKPFEVVPGSFKMPLSTDGAGAHEDLTTEFDFAHDAAGHTFNDLRTVTVNLPAGFTASNTAVPTCTFNQLLTHAPEGVEKAVAQPPYDGFMSECPPDSQVGTITFSLTGVGASVGLPVAPITEPLYNMEVTSYGVTAELAFNTLFETSVLVVRVRPGDSGLSVTTPNIEQVYEPHAIRVVTWGVPASPAHDAERGRECFPNESGEIECRKGGEKVTLALRPFLSNPTSCGPFTATMEADSWEHPAEWTKAQTTVGPVGECERVHFDPAIEAQPTTDTAESSSGLDVSLGVPQAWEDPFSLATSNLKEARVILPDGYTVNPSEGSGLAGCTPTEYEAETSSSPPGSGCPPESKLGTVEIETPVLNERINGNIYLAMPYDNPFSEPGHPNGSLIALYVVAKVPDRGILVKTAGKVEANPVTGQLTSTFEDTPQQPFSHFTIKFRQGAASPLVSPPACGRYTIQAELTPWSAPLEPRSETDSFAIEKGIGGGPCPSGGVPPFKPQVISGTQSNAAGSYSPFYLRILRNDGEQEITKFTTVLPAGLTGNLTGIPFCSEADIEAARHATGTQEINEPSCPAASEIGHTIVEAGVGSVLAQTPGKIYLAGPYHGSNLSIVSITSATVGPFDLGTVVIRFGLRINPLTAQVEVDGSTSDPIPHIIDGIVVHVRSIRVYMDRPDFTRNPTSCTPMSISETITGAGANPSDPSDGMPVLATAPFQAADCANLQFKPVFKVTTIGKTSRKTGAGLAVKLTYPKALQGSQANIQKVKVDLPKQLPSRLTTLQKACTNAQFEANPAGCPSASKVGYAVANTPILPVPLEGPAYFVSHGGAKFPELIIVIQGYGFTIDLHGETFINKAGITSSTFHAIPDEPVTSFELTLPQGPDSALAANGNLCTSKLTMPTAFVAQNGAETHQTTKITATGCPKVRETAKKTKGKRNKSKHNKKQ